MILPSTMAPDEMKIATHDQIVLAYIRDGLSRRTAEAFVAELQSDSGFIE